MGDGDGGAAAARGALQPERLPQVRRARHTVGRILGVRDPPLQPDNLPPSGHVQNGPRQRPDGRSAARSARARRRGAACRRRLHHAQYHLGQHQRAHHHDRREGLRHDQAALVQVREQGS